MVYEMTLPVGATRGRFLPALAEGSGLRPGVDPLVAHSPERVSSGSVFADLRRYPKLVGGVDAASAERAAAFYRQVLAFDEGPDLPRPNGVWDVGSAEAAELTKLAATTYRDLNIGFANELAVYADRMGIDIAEVIAAPTASPTATCTRRAWSAATASPSTRGSCWPVPRTSACPAWPAR